MKIALYSFVTLSPNGLAHAQSGVSLRPEGSLWFFLVIQITCKKKKKKKRTYGSVTLTPECIFLLFLGRTWLAAVGTVQAAGGKDTLDIIVCM